MVPYNTTGTDALYMSTPAAAAAVAKDLTPPQSTRAYPQQRVLASLAAAGWDDRFGYRRNHGPHCMRVRRAVTVLCSPCAHAARRSIRRTRGRAQPHHGLITHTERDGRYHAAAGPVRNVYATWFGHTRRDSADNDGPPLATVIIMRVVISIGKTSYHRRRGLPCAAHWFGEPVGPCNSNRSRGIWKKHFENYAILCTPTTGGFFFLCQKSSLKARGISENESFDSRQIQSYNTSSQKTAEIRAFPRKTSKRFCPLQYVVAFQIRESSYSL